MHESTLEAQKRVLAEKVAILMGEKKDLIKASHDSLMKARHARADLTSDAPPAHSGRSVSQAIDACKPGFFYRDVGGIITSHINGCGFAVHTRDGRATAVNGASSRVPP